MKTLLKVFLPLTLTLTLSGCFGPDQAIKETNQFISSQQVDKENKDWKTTLKQPPLLTFTEGKKYFWDLATNQGEISIELFHTSAPMHVSSTIYLTELGFYDGLIFHRIIPEFMAQGGDPLGSGRGNPGYKYAGEFDAKLSHDKPGILSMANAGPNTDGSQFFITFKPTPFLDGRHTIFGQVVKGLDETLAKLETLGSRTGKTSTEVVINKATIRIE
ncbi:peptidylprolyl isomerase [Pseudoalteromonas tunicata]|uniref:peptidylprolyl isomerase n=1 Tax=Pseudoalteromonas tunicata TaxID=314281 RepID=UPI0027400A61|nr:peptidylprolyl isomerase [Pseudoalteromonas tunicata]MDP5212979.1 peptidylprolyl isomerase [Pseudoalteromonas tunicata]